LPELRTNARAMLYYRSDPFAARGTSLSRSIVHLGKRCLLDIVVTVRRNLITYRDSAPKMTSFFVVSRPNARAALTTPTSTSGIVGQPNDRDGLSRYGHSLASTPTLPQDSRRFLQRLRALEASQIDSGVVEEILTHPAKT
jgi:hypothetical protein